MTTLPAAAHPFLDGTEIAAVATIEPDGRPQVSPVWVRRDGDDILFSTTAGRRKPANLRRDPRVTVLVVPRAAPYSYLEVRGRATLTPDPEGTLIQELSQKYTGGAWADDPGVERLIVRITPERVVFRE